MMGESKAFHTGFFQEGIRLIAGVVVSNGDHSSTLVSAARRIFRENDNLNMVPEHNQRAPVIISHHRSSLLPLMPMQNPAALSPVLSKSEHISFSFVNIFGLLSRKG
jgi:hypothetical protein